MPRAMRALRNQIRAIAVQTVRALITPVALLASALSLGADAGRYEYRTDHDPDGIGKFYLGREIAQVMGPAGIPWLERGTREAEEQSTLMLIGLGLRGGETIVDFGAGSGYYTFRLAEIVGPRGTVIAVDVEPKMLAFIRQRAARENLTNVGLIQSTPTDPRLPANRIDLVLMVDVYHELEFPYETLRKIRESLKRDGRVALVEFRQEDPAVPIKQLHKMSEAQLKLEMAAAGFVHIQTIDVLPIQHLAIFGKGE